MFWMERGFCCGIGPGASHTCNCSGLHGMPAPAGGCGFAAAQRMAVLSSGENQRGVRVLELVVILKALTEVAGLALIGQGILFALAGAKREQNFPYVIFRTVTRPVFMLARLLAPRFVLDRHIWLLTPALVFVIWAILTYFKVTLVLESG